VTVSNGSHTLPFRYGAASHIGMVREQNEDAYALEPEAGLFVVSDGMGGHQGGEMASRIVVQDLVPVLEVAVARLRRGHPRTIRRLLHRHVAQQSREVLLEAHSESGYKDMGATVVLALFHRDRAYIANLGDSRAYRLRQGRLRQLSQDHSVVAELVEQGHITPTEAETHEEGNVITRYIGMETRARPSVCSFSLRPGDRILLCTDGLTDMVEEGVIAQTLNTEQDCQAACDRLIGLANDGGGVDNTTVVLLTWQG
jgi:serine/threonine protein phosphatase PrpC